MTHNNPLYALLFYLFIAGTSHTSAQDLPPGVTPGQAITVIQQQEPQPPFYMWNGSSLGYTPNGLQILPENMTGELQRLPAQFPPESVVQNLTLGILLNGQERARLIRPCNVPLGVEPLRLPVWQTLQAAQSWPGGVQNVPLIFDITRYHRSAEAFGSLSTMLESQAAFCNPLDVLQDITNGWDALHQPLVTNKQNVTIAFVRKGKEQGRLNFQCTASGVQAGVISAVPNVTLVFDLSSHKTDATAWEGLRPLVQSQAPLCNLGEVQQGMRGMWSSLQDR